MVIIFVYLKYFWQNTIIIIIRVTPNSRRFDASKGGAWFDSQSHSRIFEYFYWNFIYLTIYIFLCFSNLLFINLFIDFKEL